MNKIKIIPTIFATDKKIFIDKFKSLKFAKNIHLDFMDGKFTKNSSISFSDMKVLSFFPDINFEIHLMAFNPQNYLNDIKNLKIKKVLIHYEVFKTDKEIIECIDTFQREKISVFLVINPKINVKKILKFVGKIDGIMIMGVFAGEEGQFFIEETYKRVNYLKKNCQNLKIQVDGGINEKNSRKLVRNGANILSVGSFISNSLSNSKNNFEKLQYLINN